MLKWLGRNIAVAGLFLGLLAAPAAASAQTRVVAAYGTTSLYNAPIWIAKERGLFEKHGLDVELIQLTGSRITAGLLSGSVQFISSSASSPFLANLGGGDTLLVGALMNRVPYDVVVRDKSIRTIEDVRGKVGALALRGDLTDASLKVVLTLNGIDPERDVTMVQGFGTDPERIAALISGSADFTVLNADYRLAYEEAGLTRLFSVMEVEGAEFMMSGIFTTKPYAEANPEAVTGYIKAMAEGLRVMATDRKGTLEIVSKYVDRPVTDLEPAYDFYHAMMQPTPMFDETLAATCLRTLEGANPAAADADVKDFYDASFVEKLQADGFFDEIAQP